MNPTSHYLRKVDAGESPKDFAVLATVETEELTGNGKETQATVKAWRFTRYRRNAGRYARLSELHGHGQFCQDIWAQISLCLDSRKMLDVWCSNAQRTLQATGFFAAIDSGLFCLRKGKWQGQATLTGPPLIIICRPAKGKGLLRICCMRNIGVDDYREMEFVGVDWPCWEQEYRIKANDPVVEARYRAELMGRYLEKWYACIKDENLGAPKQTLGAQAWAGFRRRFLKTPCLCHNNVRANTLESDSLHGGRAECFKIGKVRGPIYHYDIVACYPTITQNEDIPCRLKGYKENDRAALSDAIGSGFAVLADVTLFTESPYFPLKEIHRTVYPVGLMRTVLCAKELKNALSHQLLRGVHRVAWYETEKVFSEWSKWVLEFRNGQKRDTSNFAAKTRKALTNALWGRFAKQDRHWQNCPQAKATSDWSEWFEPNEETGELDHYRSIGGLVQRQVNEGFNRESLPAITAWVNSLGRSKLWELMEHAGRENVLYVATDSLMVNYQGAWNLAQCQEKAQKCGVALAQKGVYSEVEYKGIHHYVIEGRETNAGVPIDAHYDTKGCAHWSDVEPISSALAKGECPIGIITKRRVSAPGAYRHGIVDIMGNVHAKTYWSQAQYGNSLG